MVNLLLVIAALLAVNVGRTGAVLKLSAPSAFPTPGKDVFVKCTVSAGETFIGWYKPDGSKIQISTTNSIRVEDQGGGVYKLQFKDVLVSDGGNYECRGSRDTDMFSLHIAFVTSDVKRIQYLEIGKTGVIKVGVFGSPGPSFSWKKDGRSLNTAASSCPTVLKDGSLKICKVTKSSLGNYAVIINQATLEDEVKIEVFSVGAPGRPIIYSPASNLLNAGTLTLMWRASVETGGDDNITYIVEYRVEKDNNHGPWKTITTKKLQVEISELDNKVLYKFEVTAKNKGGTSGPAEKYIQTKPTSSSQTRLVSSAFLTISVGGIFLLLAFGVMNADN